MNRFYTGMMMLVGALAVCAAVAWGGRASGAVDCPKGCVVITPSQTKMGNTKCYKYESNVAFDNAYSPTVYSGTAKAFAGVTYRTCPYGDCTSDCLEGQVPASGTGPQDCPVSGTQFFATACVGEN
jgi:hypothetical protein